MGTSKKPRLFWWVWIVAVFVLGVVVGVAAAIGALIVIQARISYVP
jgi:hypothetical protein